MDNERLAELHQRAEAELGRIPGVAGVGFGLKEVGGVVTDERAFRVYVVEKKPEAEVPDDEVLPREFGGVPVDVLVVREFQEIHCEDMTQHHPLIGGISISSFKPSGPNYPSGTLGFFATLNGVSGPKNVVLVSNEHVIMANTPAVGDTIYQPKYVDTGGGVAIDLSAESKRAIAEIHDAGLKANYSFAYPSEAAQDYYVDCATALLNISISSWCDSNCGVSYKNEIRQLDMGGNSKIEDVARVTQADLDAPGDYVVAKVGRRTSKTVGRIVDIAATLTSADRVIEIEPTAPNCNGVNQFVNEGDSGSALVNAQNRLVGLIFGQGTGAEIDRGFACHIHPVLDRLKVTAISTANPPVGPAGQTRSDRMARIGGEEDLSVRLRQRARATATGAALFELFEEHREEMLGLVNYHRPVTIAWHRGKGPTFLAHLAENASRPEHRIPSEIDGVTRRDLLLRMEEALTASGSEPLRRAIAEHRETVLALHDDFDDLHELVGRFEERPAHV